MNIQRLMFGSLVAIALLTAGLLVALPKQASAQTPDPSTVGTSISIEVDTVEEVHSVTFRFCLVGDDGPLSQCIGLNDGDALYTFDDLADDTYELAFQGRDGWRVDSFRCLPRDGANVFVVEADAFARIVIDGDGDHYACRAVFERAPEPTAAATATATLVPTSTATPVPPTSTPAPTFMPVPPAPTAAPPLIIVATAPPSLVIRPPNTGDGGLLP